MKKTGIFINKPVYLVLPIAELSKILMYEFWCDYVKPKYGGNSKLCYVDRNSFIVYMKTDDIYKDIAEDYETRLNNSNYELDTPFPKGKYDKITQKVIALTLI